MMIRGIKSSFGKFRLDFIKILENTLLKKQYL